MARLEGFLIAMQFFTAIPVRRPMELDQKRIAYAVQSLPAAGLIIGGLLSVVLWLIQSFTPLSVLAAAFAIWLGSILLTGGLHLDGWMDASDACFSYRDKEKRLEIMSDPRTGAFGVLSVLVLLSARFLFIYEVVSGLRFTDYFLIAMIPFVSRIGMGLLLVRVPAVKKEGLAYFFQKDLTGKTVAGTYILFFLIVSGVMAASEPALAVYFWTFTGVQLLFSAAAERKIRKEFGGITGDLLGASAEGGETVLWMTLWLLHYFVMA
ncbi:adenosylcobinamide-GDP ribazoletransferase [Bacillus mangrovi]|uniref:Adenosylcobinamide-GDP ribazoletransferase n=2 Tax=Metabacillus mangrovi TaxID=1491830 RepID=A0A7X2S4E8_9BACI|nr:adenosylcobinamide-GDP ribazoletransferase [Metabacillus mangrovi]